MARDWLFPIRIAIVGAGPFAAALTLTAAQAGADGVRVTNPGLGVVLRGAVQGASARLADPRCAAVLSDFHDARGRPLRDRLEPPPAAAADYLHSMFFYDGANLPTCKRSIVYAFTTPGSHVVRVCPALGWLAGQDRDRAEVVVIHEMLHSLGLGENPPTSAQITAAVSAHCTGHDGARQAPSMPAMALMGGGKK